MKAPESKVGNDTQKACFRGQTSQISRRTIMANPFVHIELQTQDLTKAKKFYSQLFDWNSMTFPYQAAMPPIP